MILHWQAMGPLGGLIGHDYSGIIPRLVLGATHFWNNGLKVFHYTAAYCGGMVQFADPQFMYYTLMQGFTFWMDPWLAIRLSMLIFYALGYWGFYRLLRDAFSSSLSLSHFGSFLFLINGYTFVNLFVGHATYLTYLLVPWFLYFLFVIPKDQNLKAMFVRSLAFAFLLGHMIYSGSIHMTFAFVVVFLIALPWLIQRWAKNWSYILKFFSMTAVLSLLSVAAKVYASGMMSRMYIERELHHSLQNPFYVFLRFLYFDPASTHIEEQWTGIYKFAAWEYVGWVSKITLPLLLLALVYFWKKKPSWKLTVSAIVLTVWSAMICLATSNNEHLPILRGYHHPLRLLCAFIPFIVIASVWGLGQFLKSSHWSSWQKKIPSFCLSAWVILPCLWLFLFFEYHHYVSYFTERKLGLTWQYDPNLYDQIQTRGELLPTKEIVRGSGDLVAMAHGLSTMNCYEPMFGYHGDSMQLKITPGPVNRVDDGAFNMTHPGCFLYPEHFNCKAWDRIRVEDRDNFEKFRNHQPAFGVPAIQDILVVLSALVSLICALGTLWNIKNYFSEMKSH